LEHRHPRVFRLHQFARVFERGPDDVFDAGSLGGRGDVLGLGNFLLPREVFPEIRHRVDAVCTGKRFLQALDVVQVALDHFGALAGHLLGFIF